MSINGFNPDDTGVANGNYFGFPQSVEDSALVLLSAPWDVTVSYNEGTAQGPLAIIDASIQVEVYDPINPEGWKKGIATAPVDEWIDSMCGIMREEACRVIECIEQGDDPASDASVSKLLEQVNEASEELNNRIYAQSKEYINQGKIVGLVGGDHSTPLGLIRAVAQEHKSIGILHIDAHADLRDAYEGFTYSHASIMFNALKLDGVDKLVQVAIRDYCTAEKDLAKNDHRVVQFTDYSLKTSEFEGESWGSQCNKIVASLPENVYVSFDIDGLSPDNCPSTGTPVPGGLSYQQAIYLMCKVVESGRRIVGFDLTEVSPNPDNQMDQWDANVGARILYKLCNLALLD